MFAMDENFVLKKLNILTFLFAVADYDDEYLNAWGKKTFKEGGEVYALQKGNKFVAFVLLDKPGEKHCFCILYIFTPPDLRRRGYAMALLRELQKKVAVLKCVLNAEWEFPGKIPFLELLRRSGFVAKEGIYQFFLNIDDLRRWTNTSYWQKYRNYLQRFRQKGWEVISFDRATGEQQDYVKNSYHNGFQSSIDPQKIFAGDGDVEPELSFILLKENQPVAFTLMKRTHDGAYTLALASTAKKYLGRGGIFMLYCETVLRLGRMGNPGCRGKYLIQETNREALAAEHFCRELNLNKCKMACYEWEC